jgi:virginiamycin B lyase
MEGRALLSTFTVTTTTDSGPGSLRQAALDADTAGTAGTINFNITSAPAGSETSYATPGAVPAGIVTGADGAIWFAERGGNAIARRDPVTGSFTEYHVTSLGNSPIFLTSAPDGTLWFAENGGPYQTAHVGRITTAPGAPKTAATTVPANSIVRLPSGVEYPGGSTIAAGTVFPVGTITEYLDPTPGVQGWFLTLTQAGDEFWFSSGGDVGRIRISDTVTQAAETVPAGQTVTTPDGTQYAAGSLIPAHTALPTGTITIQTGAVHGYGGNAVLTLGPEGDLWVADVTGAVERLGLSDHAVAAATTLPSNVFVVLPAGFSLPSAVARHAGDVIDQLYSLTSNCNVLLGGSALPAGTVLPAGTATYFVHSQTVGGPQPYAVAFDSGGRLWVGERFSQGLYRLDTTTGTFTAANVTNQAYVTDFVTGRDGNLWFSEFQGGKIGRIDASGNVTEVYPVSGVLSAALTG